VKLRCEQNDVFLCQVRQIEKADAVLTSKEQIERLNRPGSKYFNLNPFDVLQVGRLLFSVRTSIL